MISLDFRGVLGPAVPLTAAMASERPAELDGVWLNADCPWEEYTAPSAAVFA